MTQKQYANDKTTRLSGVQQSNDRDGIRNTIIAVRQRLWVTKLASNSFLQKHSKTVPKSRCHSRIGFFTHSSPNKISGGGNTNLFLDAGRFKDEVFEAGVLFASNYGTRDLMKTPSECSSQKSSLCTPSSFFGIPGYYLRVIMAPEACPQWSFLSLPGYYLRVTMAPEAFRQWLCGDVWAAC